MEKVAADILWVSKTLGFLDYPCIQVPYLSHLCNTFLAFIFPLNSTCHAVTALRCDDLGQKDRRAEADEFDQGVADDNMEKAPFQKGPHRRAELDDHR